MLDGQRYSFTERIDSLGRSVILPYIPLSGNLARSDSRGLVVAGTITPFPPVLLGFAWTEMRDTPVILGHMNFFAEFNVCVYRHELAFEVCPKDR